MSVVNRLVRTINGEVITLSPVTTVITSTVTTKDSTSSSVTESLISLASSTISTTTTSSSGTQYTSSSTYIGSGSTTVTTSTSTSSNFSIGAKTNALDTNGSNTSSKTGLIVGLSVGIPVFLLILAGGIYFIFYKNTFNFQKNEDKNIWINSQFDWSNKHNNEESMVKTFKFVRQIQTPVKAYHKPSPNKRFSDWKSHIITPYKTKNVLEKDLETGMEDNYLDYEEENSNNNKYYSSSEKTKSSLSTEEDEILQVDTFLYKNPPKIKKITSLFSSNKSTPITNNSISQTRKNKKLPKKLDLDNTNINNNINNNVETIQSKWSYRSPLSKWFLRDSTYLQHSLPTTPVEQTLSVDLKTLQLPSEKRKQKNNNIKDNSISNNGKPKIRNHLIDINSMGNIKLFQKPLPNLPNEQETRLSLLKGDFEEATPLARDSLYMVTRDYKPQLLDELEIHIGECVKVLSTHSDGWALVTINIKEMKYMDDSGCKGVVPLACLEKMDSISKREGRLK